MYRVWRKVIWRSIGWSESNQSAPLVAAMETAPATSKPAGVVEKKMSRVQKILKRKDQGC